MPYSASLPLVVHFLLPAPWFLAAVTALECSLINMNMPPYPKFSMIELSLLNLCRGQNDAET